MSTGNTPSDNPKSATASEVEVWENQEVDDLGGSEEPVSEEMQAELDRASQTFVGRWNRLVSTTNWEKGRIILQWREQLQETDAPPSEYSDEAWARRVGGITGQHVGRLRRVYQRFGSTQESYAGLFWSHFHAAIDWNDAEMWLEGAAQNDWSVSQVRRQRWDTLGQTDPEPQEADVIRGELDEDFEQNSSRQTGTNDHQGPLAEDPDFGEEPTSKVESVGSGATMEDEADRVDRVQPFENLPELPDDLNDAFDTFKLAILRHKGNNWSEIGCADVLAALESLKQLALAPSE